jgi:hypothetical protein
MKLDIRAVALASGTVASALFALCTLFVALAPEATVLATRELFHLAVASPPAITWIGVLSGLLFWFLGTAVAAAAFATIHNRWMHG